MVPYNRTRPNYNEPPCRQVDEL